MQSPTASAGGAGGTRGLGPALQRVNCSTGQEPVAESAATPGPRLCRKMPNLCPTVKSAPKPRPEEPQPIRAEEPLGPAQPFPATSASLPPRITSMRQLPGPRISPATTRSLAALARFLENPEHEEIEAGGPGPCLPLHRNPPPPSCTAPCLAGLPQACNTASPTSLPVASVQDKV